MVVLAQKIVSKSEGRVISLAGIEPSERAVEIAGDEEDPRRIEVILREAARVVRVRPPLVIAETTHGFICASAGVDASNAPEREMLQAAIDKSQEFVTGRVKLKLYKGNTTVVGRESKYSLYDQELVTFEEGAVAYDHRDAEGFIKLNALRLRTLGQRRRKLKLD